MFEGNGKKTQETPPKTRTVIGDDYDSTGLNKDKLWGWWHDKVKKDNKLYMKAAHKALDIPEDDMLDASNSHNQTTRVGTTWKEICAIGILAIGLLMGLNYIVNYPNKSDPPPATSTGDNTDTWMDLFPDPVP